MCVKVLKRLCVNVLVCNCFFHSFVELRIISGFTMLASMFRSFSTLCLSPIMPFFEAFSYIFPHFFQSFLRHPFPVCLHIPLQTVLVRTPRTLLSVELRILSCFNGFCSKLCLSSIMPFFLAFSYFFLWVSPKFPSCNLLQQNMN